MSYLLILWVTTGGTGLATIEYPTKAACEQVAQIVKEMDNKYMSTSTGAYCIPAGKVR